VSESGPWLIGTWRRCGWLGRTVMVGLGMGSAVFVLMSLSVVNALSKPGNESFSAKWADTLRDHHASFIVTPLEDWYFTRSQPAKGGRPVAINKIPGVKLPTVSSTPDTTIAPAPTTTVAAPKHLAAPHDVALTVQPPLDNEGKWLPAGPTVQGVPGMYVAQFRADNVYTSQITTAAWIDPMLLRVHLNPGEGEPGGAWSVAPVITGDALKTIVAAFNGGFRFKEAQGGFHLDGRDGVALRTGAASIAITTDGKVDVGKWGSDVGLAPDTEGVLQNLTLLVDGGQVDPSVSHNDTRAWGATLKGSIAVARSGIGITTDGALIYVAGPALTARTLAESLQRAGAVRAMTLDINPQWVTFNLFDHPNPADPSVVTGAKLYPQMQRPANRYLSTESRDYFTVSLRG